MTADRLYDVVVVGGGTAGCVVAARISEDPAVRVLLIEAGPDPRPMPDVIANPRRQGELVRDTDYVRRYPVTRPDGSTFPLLSGRIMGGGSAVNNLAAIRPMRRDFDTWATYGGAAWSYDALLPIMRDLETDPDFPGSAIHGGSGPLLLHRPLKLTGPLDPTVGALVAAAGAVGLPPCHDMNGPEPFGICSSPYNLRDGVRLSTAIAWLEPARHRPNLAIRSATAVLRVVLDGSRATGVDVAGAGGLEHIAAGEVVLAAGVFHSPQLLMLSGIGPVGELERATIDVRHPLEGVGANFQDHAVVAIEFAAGPALRAHHSIPKVRIVARSAPERDLPDLHIFMREPTERVGRGRVLPVSLHLLDHRSRGRVALSSPDPSVLPVVHSALLEDAADRAALTDGIALVCRLAAHPVVAPFYGPLLTPASRDDWTTHVATTFTTYHHGVGTCRLGPRGDILAVVDPRLRVHGLDNVTVADASVLPTIPHANTNLAAIVVGEIAARQLLSAGAADAAS